MLLVILCWVYIFLTSYMCGEWVKQICFRKDLPIGVVLQVLLGLGFIMVLSGYYNFFFPINLYFHLLLLLIVLSGLLYNHKIFKHFFFSEKEFLKNLFWHHKVFLIVVLFYALFESSGNIVNADTGLYHLQGTKWIEEYHVIKGVANVLSYLGHNFQYWNLNAVFGFSFLFGTTIHALNAFFFILFIYYIVRLTGDEKFWSLISIIILFFVVNMSHAVASMSSDFPATCVVCMAILEMLKFLNTENKNYHFPLLFLMLCLIATLFKLSASLIVFFLPLFFRKEYFIPRYITKAIILITVIVTPYIVKNYYSSGYLIYPLYQIDIFNPDWKLPVDITIFEKELIKYSYLGLPYGSKIHYPEVFIIWFKYLKKANPAYIPLIAIFISSVIAYCFLLTVYIKKRFYKLKNILILGVIILAILVFWFKNGPEPRYINGFIFPFIGMVFAYIAEKLSEKFLPRFDDDRIVKAILLIYTLVLISALFNFKISNPQFAKNRASSFSILIQKPYPAQAVMKIEKNKVRYVTIDSSTRCWDAPLPCGYQESSYEERGYSIREGFRHSNSASK